MTNKKERLTNVINFLGMNKQQLCEVLEISPALLRKIISGERRLVGKTLLKLTELEGQIRNAPKKTSVQSPAIPPIYYLNDKIREVQIRIQKLEQSLSIVTQTFHHDQLASEKLRSTVKPKNLSKIALSNWQFHKDNRLLDLSEKMKLHARGKIFPLQASLAGLNEELKYWQHLVEESKKSN